MQQYLTEFNSLVANCPNWFNVQVLRIAIYGIATNRIQAGMGETTPDFITRLIDDAELNRVIFAGPGQSKIRDFADVIDGIEKDVAERGESAVIKTYIFDAGSSIKNRSQATYPVEMLTALPHWLRDGGSECIVHDLDFSSLAYLLREAGMPTAVASNQICLALWRVLKAATGLDFDLKLAEETLNKSESGRRSDADSAVYLVTTNNFYCSDVDDKADYLQAVLNETNGRVAVFMQSPYLDKLRIRNVAAASGRLSLVAAYPDNLLANTPDAATLLLFESSENAQSEIKFFDLAKSKNFGAPLARGRRVMTEAAQAEVAAMLAGEPVDFPSRTVSAEVVRAAYNRIDPAYWIAEEQQRAVTDRISRFKRTVADIADVIRPAPLRAAQTDSIDRQSFRTVSSGDITAEGRVSRPESSVDMPVNRQRGAFLNTILRPNDIVFVHKGAVGRCGIVDENFRDVILGPSTVCIRLHEGVKDMSAPALMRYLRSPGFRPWINQIVKDVADNKKMLFMSAKDVEKFPVPELSEEQIAAEQHAFDEQTKLIEKRKLLDETIRSFEFTAIPEDWR